MYSVDFVLKSWSQIIKEAFDNMHENELNLKSYKLISAQASEMSTKPPGK